MAAHSWHADVRALWRLMLAAALLGGATPAAAAAATCLSGVQRLAARYNLSTDPPNLQAEQEAQAPTTENLAQSGGVIEPPPTSDQAVIEPPEGLSNMPTLPDVSEPSETPIEGSVRALNPADSALLQSILVAARSEAERGQETDCLTGLQKAYEFIATKAGK